MSPCTSSLSLFFHTKLLDSGCQVHSKRVHTVCCRYSFFLPALTHFVLQEATRSNHLVFFIVPILSDRQFEAFCSQLLLAASSSPSLQFQPLACFFLIQSAVMSSTETLNLAEGKLLQPHSAHPATQYAEASNNILDGMPRRSAAAHPRILRVALASDARNTRIALAKSSLGS